MFQATEEFLTFRLFCTDTSPELSGAFESTRWNRIALQESHQYAFLRHAIVTIGSLSKNIKETLNKNDIPPSTGPELWNNPPVWLRGNNDFALRQYNKFLRGSRQALVTGPEGQRLALIVCLLIICIETLQWHHLQVLSHIYSGVQLLDSFLASQEVAMQAGFPPYIIESEIIVQFRMLEVEAKMLFDPFPASNHHIQNLEGQVLTSSMPESFSSVNEAKYYLDLITRRIRHFIASSRPVKPSKTNSGHVDTSCIDPELLSLTPPGLRSTFDNPSPPSVLTRDLNFYTSLTHLTSLLSTWQSSFTPLFQSATDPSSPAYLPTLLLAISSEALTINLDTVFSTSTSPLLAYDTHFSSFTRIVALSSTILHHPSCASFLSQNNNITSSTGLIGPLRLVAEKCRNRTLRHEAISLLRLRPWREGVWWSCSSAQLGAWLAAVEEEDVDEREEVMPEWARARLLEVGIWEEGVVTTVKVVGVRGEGNDAAVRVGEWVWRVCGEEEGVGVVVGGWERDVGRLVSVGSGFEEVGECW
ncbi:hypothetical protein ONS96_003979 [Cadophora gregata f. sp. sojae]|nr:hypothetical protein ONS96_003979 [Cadophora gregata f. sp. sojae]